MTFEVVFEEKAINRMAGFLVDDPHGVERLFEAIDALAKEPRPAESFPYGSPDLRRLRLGRYRVLYEIRANVISIGHVARRASA